MSRIANKERGAWPVCCARNCDHVAHSYPREDTAQDMARFVTSAGYAYCVCCAREASLDGVEAFVCDKSGLTP